MHGDVACESKQRIGKIWLFVHGVTQVVEKEYIYKDSYALHPNAMSFKPSTTPTCIHG
jgi:hypothetical protein